MPTNDFVPFCNENTGTNLPTQSDYLANPNLPIGNQPGIASSSFNNKALRQATTIGAIVAQYVSNATSASMLDTQNSANHAIPTALLAALTAALKYHSPVVTSYLTGGSSGSHNLTYKFQIASGSATAGATYSDGTTTYTVKTTVASATQVDATGGADPSAVTGTLTKTSGTGDTTLTFYAYRKPLYIRVRAQGAGGGGGGGGTAGATSGGAGGNTTFGTTLIVANGGGGGGSRSGTVGTPGTASLGSGPVGIAIAGGYGTSGFGDNATAIFVAGGCGGNGGFGGGGGAGVNDVGTPAAANSGSGGGGGGTAANAGANGGNGGAAGGFVDAYITAPLATYAYAVGSQGTAGTAGTNGGAGGLGGTGALFIWEHYQ
jgi:hypothetical protein